MKVLAGGCAGTYGGRGPSGPRHFPGPESRLETRRREPTGRAIRLKPPRHFGGKAVDRVRPTDGVS